MKRFLLFLLIAVMLAPSLMARGNADAGTYQLRTSTNLVPTGTVGMALTRFVELVNQRSGGRIRAVANYGNELGSQAEQVQMTRAGALEMVVASPGSGLGTWIPQLACFELPFIYTDIHHNRRVLKGMEEEVSRLVQPLGFIARSGQSQGARHILTMTPVHSLADMRGLRMRGPNATYVAMFEALGAAGTTTDWNEVYTALQSRVIDGMEASPSMINSMRFQDIARNMTITNHVIAQVFYFFNADWLNSLPADLRQIVLQAADDAAVYQAEIDDVDQEVALQEMIAAGVNVIQPTDINAWISATAPMVDQFRARGPEWADFINRIMAIR